MKLPPILALMLALACCGALFSLTVTNIEYYFDADPGPGNGTQLLGRNTVEINELIDTAGLAPGIHRFYTRARNDQGLWSLPQGSAFFIPFTAPAFIDRTVASIEYYFDADPGPGNGSQIFERNTVDLDELIATATLVPGIHRLYVRARDNTGIWGLPQSTAFFIPFSSLPFTERTVASIEYYFDADPGTGNGTQVYGRNVVELDELIATAALVPGIHRLYVRSRDNTGIWGLPQSMAFLIPWSETSGTVITRLEYFLDSDPGFGNGTLIEVTPGASVSMDIPITVGPIEHGNHCLYVRAQNDEGGWGLPACCQFSDGIPAFLTISITDGVVALAWQDLYGIDTYKVYSAPLPEGTWAEDLGGSFGASDWTAPESGLYRFYKVTSIYGE